MKTKILITALFCTCLFNSAKAQSVQVIYETQPQMQMKIDGLDESFIDQIRKSTKIRNILCYNNGESVYKTMKNEDGNSSSGIKIMTSASEDVTYRNHKTNKEIAYKDFFGKGFLIESELGKDGKWEITDSTKDIHGYTCKKAISKSDKQETVVWFCPNLPIKDGPLYTGLDGLVLEMTTNNLSIVAKEIISSDADCQITAPKKGKKISKEEFDKMVEKRMKAMEQTSGDGGGMVIKIMR
ncbi:MAG: GLPGLI family protein [Prevotellaceae bacterium]|jgi:GLPGLI family protein|nr:GLPGLI family protein [Prevotellaceae bacterium]